MLLALARESCVPLPRMRFATVFVTLVLLSCVLPAPVAGDCLTTKRTKNGTSIIGYLGAKDAKVALQNSGPPLAISLGSAGVLGVLAGVDVYPLMYHGAWLANAQFVPSLNVNYTFCTIPAEENKEAQASKTSCPCSLEEKFYTFWTRSFSPFTCRFSVFKPDEGVEPQSETYKGINAFDVMCGFVGVCVVLVVYQIPNLFRTRNYYKDANDSAERYGRCGKCPQNKIPCMPFRYWAEFPNLLLNLLVGVHIGLSMSALSSLGAIRSALETGDILSFVGTVVLCVITVFAPILSLVTVCCLVKVKQRVGFSSKPKYLGWRDREGRVLKTWRQSERVNRYGALFARLKENRFWWVSYRMIFNLVEAAVILIVPFGNDIRSLIIVGIYFLQAIFLLLMRPYRSALTTSMEMLQMFHNVFVYMASTLYNADSEIFNAQSLLKVDTDGVEEMMMALGSGMTVIHTLVVFSLALGTFWSSFKVCQKGDPAVPEWDVECRDKKLAANSKEQDTKTVENIHAVNEESWTMKRVVSKPAVAASNTKEVHMITRNNPLRQKVEDAKIAAKTPASGKPNAVKESNMTVETSDRNAKQNPLKAKLEAKRRAEANSEGKTKKAEGAGEVAKDPMDGWTEMQDPASGRSYYHNNKTGEVTWDKPGVADATLPPEWTAAQDPASKRTYYYNSKTQVTQWERPSVVHL